jgi:hypothetical protein
MDDANVNVTQNPLYVEEGAEIIDKVGDPVDFLRARKMEKMEKMRKDAKRENR